MKLKVLFVFALLLTCVCVLQAQEDTNTPAAAETKIASVKIEGNQRIATETYLYYISVKAGVAYDESVLRNDFKRLWGTGFLSDLKITTETTPAGVDVTFKVEEKPLVKAIEYSGNKKISKDDIETKLKDSNITIKTDQPLDKYMAQKVTNAIEQLMVEKGLQFGSAIFKTESLGGPNVKLTFVVDEGPKVRIGKIEFEGNDVFSDGKLRRRMKETRQHWMFSWISRHDDFEKEKFEKDMDRVRELYFNKGYINARIDEPKIELYEDSGFLGKKKRILMTIPLEEGKQYRTGDIKFEGNKVFTAEQLMPTLELKKGEVFNRGLLKKGLEEMQKKYGDQGYIYASLGPIYEPQEDTKTVNLNIQVEENGQFFVHRIEFTGNNYTRDKVIRRELQVQEGDLLRVTRFRDSLDRIYRLGFFDDLKPNINPVEGSQNQADISIDVKENKRNEIRLGGGYSEFEGFFGNLTFSTKNLFGTGKIFTINLQGGSRSENYGIDILEPYFLDRRISLGFSVYKTRYDYFSYLRDTTGGSLTLGFPLFEEFKGLVTYAYQVVDIELPPNSTVPNVDDSIFPGIELFQSDRTESRFGPQLVRSTINNPTDPSRGTRFLYSNEFVGGFLGGDVNYYKPAVSWTHYMRGITKKHYFAYNVEMGWATGFGGQELPFYERYFLGGERSIRGYEIRVVAPIAIDPTTKRQFIAGGNKFFVANLEYVVPIGGPLKLAGFLDYGNAFSAGDTLDFSDMRGSLGLEFRFLAPFLSAPFRFIYAFNFNRGELMTLPINFRPKRTLFRFSVGTTF